MTRWAARSPYLSHFQRTPHLVAKDGNNGKPIYLFTTARGPNIIWAQAEPSTYTINLNGNTFDWFLSLVGSKDFRKAR